MRRFLCAGTALAVCCFVGLGASSAAAQSGSETVQALFAGEDAGVQTAAFEGGGTAEEIKLASCDGGCGDYGCGESYSDCGCGDLGCNGGCGVGGGGMGLGMGNNCTGQLYFGSEYLHVRANYSQNISYVTQDISGQTPAIIFNQFDYDYNSNYRFYGGYRVCECGCDLRFTYTHLESDASFDSGVVPGNSSLRFFSPLEVVADVPGTSLNGRSSVELDTYDIAFSKTIPLGSPLCGGCGDACGCGETCCGDACGCGNGCGCYCPAWDITWSGGVRVADMEAENVYDNTIPTNTALEQTSASRTSFSGAGLRTGMMGRRYIGKQGMASFYVKGDISLLMGDLDIVAESVSGTAFARHEISCTHVIPVTEIEVGGTVALTSNINVTGGWFLAAWHDLGNRVEYPFSTQPTGVQLDNFDDANILGWDGFFVRAEATF